MRPLKLIMNAFGPYKSEQVIDFTLINDKNLFLITGPTGAGKTTIFDGIAYALYGKASGSERDKDNFRSDFADESDVTYVELEFELKNKFYKIYRSPKQLKPKVNGNGYTEKGAEATLIIDDKEHISGPKKVDEEIIKIFGINYDQFKQLVMLPQGEFRKLLNADSKEREDIFRKIFGTHLFKRVQETLEDKSRNLRNEIKGKKQELDTYIKSLNSGDNQTLQALLTVTDYNYPEIIIELEKDIEASNVKYNKQRKELEDKRTKEADILLQYNNAVDINLKHDNLKQLREELKILYKQEPNIEQIKKALNVAKKALKIKPYEEKYRLTKSDLAISEGNIEKLETNIKKTRQLEKIKKQEKDCLDSEKAKIKELEIQVENYITKYNQFQEYQNVLISLKDVTSELNKLKNNITGLGSEYQHKLNHVNQTVNQVLPGGTIDETILKINENINQNKYQNNHFTRILNKIKTIIDLQIKHKDKAIIYEDTKKLLKQKQAEYEEYEELFRKEQAGILALNLTDGNPCPVCGSLHHPNKAEIKNVDLSESRLEEFKVEYEKQMNNEKTAYDNVHRINSMITSNENDLKEMITELNGEYQTDLAKTDMQTYYTFIEKQIEVNNQNRILLTQMSHSLEEDKNSLERIKQTIEENKMNQANLQINYSSVKTKYDTFVQQELDKFVSSEEINTIITNKKAEINLLENKITSVEEEYKKLQLILERLQGQLSENKAQVKILSDKLFNDKRVFKNLIDEADISMENYLIGKENIININHYEKQITNYREIQLQLETKIQSLENDILNTPIIDLSILKDQLDAIRNEMSVQDNMLKLIFSKIENNSRLYKDINNTFEEIADVNKTYADVSAITEIALGKNNQRLTFERYVLAVYFDEIINASNIRLCKMTNDRYIMLRKDEKGKGAAQQGLDLEVFDNYTGKKRDIKTLSGGESFKASLSLALGLADIVQNYAGGINLDTIFIDEGFGSLDPESLESAIECLVSLRDSGRLVGVISHVQDLKERIDVKLEISTSNNGSSAKFIY